MYAPSSFRVTAREALASMVGELRFASLVVNGEDGPVAAHLPLVFEAGSDTVLIGHLARANPLAALVEEGRKALALFIGPSAYVSPSWYESKREHGKVVPTWNYVAVQARGVLSPVSEPAALHAIIDQLTVAQEAGRAHPWAVDDAPADFVAGMMKAIIGFRLTLSSLEGMAKLSQNRPAPDREGVRRAMEAAPDAAARHLATMMRP